MEAHEPPARIPLGATYFKSTRRTRLQNHRKAPSQKISRTVVPRRITDEQEVFLIVLLFLYNSTDDEEGDTVRKENKVKGGTHPMELPESLP